MNGQRGFGSDSSNNVESLMADEDFDDTVFRCRR